MRHIFKDLIKRDVRLLLRGDGSVKRLCQLLLRLPSCITLPIGSPSVKRSYYSRLLHAVDAFSPLEVHIENTNACDAACIMCPREKMTRKIGFMDYQLFCSIIDQIVSMWIVRDVHLHGFGEPLLDRSLPEKIAYAKKKGIENTYIVTTASQLNEETAFGLIQSGLDRMKISISGAEKESYDRIHRGLTYENIEKNILDFISLRKKTGGENPSLTLQFLPQDENRGEEEAFFRKWENVIEPDKGDRLARFGLHNWVRGKRYRDAGSQALRRRSCGFPFRVMQILWNGDVVPCCYDYNGDMVLSSLRECSLDEAWNSRSFKTFRALHLAGEFDKLPLCHECDQLDVMKT